MESLGTGARGGYGTGVGLSERGGLELERGGELKQFICFAYHLMLVNQLLTGRRL